MSIPVPAQASAPRAAVSQVSAPLHSMTPASAFSRAQKAAILLGLLGTEAAGPVFEGLDEGSVKRFVRAMAGLGQVEPEVVRAVVREFLAEIEQAEHSVQGGLNAARTIIDRHLDKAVASRILDELDVFSGRNVWMRLSVVDAQVMAEFLAREHPQSAALILSRLSPEHAGRIVSLLDFEKAQQVVMAIRKIVRLPASSVDAIAESINRTLFTSKVSSTATQPAERLGSIINHASGEFRDSIIEFLEGCDPEFADETKRNMFTFPDIEARLRRQDVGAVVRSVDPQTLIKALAGAEKNAPETKKFILANMSTRMAEAIAQEIKEAGVVRRKEIDIAQSEVIKAIQRLEQSGEITLVKDDEE